MTAAVGTTRGRLLDPLAVGELEGGRLLAEHVLPGLDRRDDLAGVLAGRRRQEDGLDVAVAEQVLVALVGNGHAELALREGARLAAGIARGDELRLRHARREIRRVPGSHATEAGDGHPQPPAGALHRRRAHSLTIRCSRHDVVAASASSSALMPSSIVVRTGLPLPIASTKWAISFAYATR